MKDTDIDLDEDTMDVYGIIWPDPGHLNEVISILNKDDVQIGRMGNGRIQFSFCDFISFSKLDNLCKDLAKLVWQSRIYINDYDTDYKYRYWIHDGHFQKDLGMDYTFYPGEEKEFAAWIPDSVKKVIVDEYLSQKKNTN